MFLRTSSGILLLALAACSSKAGDQGAGGGLFGGEEVPAEKVPCALADAKTFTAVCTVERVNQDGKAMLIVHHPDGGFRRLVAMDGGKNYATVDGSDEVAIEANGKEIEVTVADDHYLFSAPGAAPASGPAGSNAPHP
jgi:hypothetical protein